MDGFVKIYMCCHKPYSVVPPATVPVQGGACMHKRISGCVPDYGDNGGISERNKEYCELTVQYYAWKNESAKAYGFCHYRRFFCFDQTVRKKYLVRKRLSPREQERYLGNTALIGELTDKYDAIVPYPEDMGVSAMEYYCTSIHHYREDMELFLQILCERFPQLTLYADKYLAQNMQYFCNMFIMRKELFNEYCSMLFEVLDEFDRKKKFHGSFQDDRTDGYLGEYFLGIYMTYLKTKGLRILEVPRIDTECSFKKRLMYILLPPESRRRAAARKIQRKLYNIERNI